MEVSGMHKESYIGVWSGGVGLSSIVRRGPHSVSLRVPAGAEWQWNTDLQEAWHAVLLH